MIGIIQASSYVFKIGRGSWGKRNLGWFLLQAEEAGVEKNIAYFGGLNLMTTMSLGGRRERREEEGVGGERVME